MLAAVQIEDRVERGMTQAAAAEEVSQLYPLGIDPESLARRAREYWYSDLPESHKAALLTELRNRWWETIHLNKPVCDQYRELIHKLFGSIRNANPKLTSLEIAEICIERAGLYYLNVQMLLQLVTDAETPQPTAGPEK
jgi:hypothetical protein